MAKKTIVITLYMSELFYDVKNKTYLTGNSRRNGNNHADVAHMQANDDDEDANEILRCIGNAYASMKTQLSEFIEESETTANNTLISLTDNFIVTLQMPSNYNVSTRDTISAAMHQYIVNSAIGDWFTITNKADAGDYIARATTDIETIRDAVNRRVRPIRPTVGA